MLAVSRLCCSSAPSSSELADWSVLSQFNPDRFPMMRSGSQGRDVLFPHRRVRSLMLLHRFAVEIYFVDREKIHILYTLILLFLLFLLLFFHLILLLHLLFLLCQRDEIGAFAFFFFLHLVNIQKQEKKICARSLLMCSARPTVPPRCRLIHYLSQA